MSTHWSDTLTIRQLIENWAVWRDAGDWDRFRTVWHDDGVMMATWFQGPYEDFIRVTIEGWNRGVSILHFLGGSSIEVQGHRAIAQTKMTISQRGPVHEVLCDVVCTGRFYDFLECRAGRWGLVHRQPIYEKDRIDPVDPSATLTLDREHLRQMPEGYRHLAYIQTGIGYQVKMDMPQLKGAEVQALYQQGANWLAGHALVR
jgi:hypothetical protein